MTIQQTRIVCIACCLVSLPSFQAQAIDLGQEPPAPVSGDRETLHLPDRFGVQGFALGRPAALPKCKFTNSRYEVRPCIELRRTGHFDVTYKDNYPTDFYGQTFIVDAGAINEGLVYRLRFINKASLGQQKSVARELIALYGEPSVKSYSDSCDYTWQFNKAHVYFSFNSRPPNLYSGELYINDAALESDEQIRIDAEPPDIIARVGTGSDNFARAAGQPLAPPPPKPPMNC